MTNRIELSISDRFPFAEGHEFGAVGPYERLVGRAHFAVDPDAPAQHGITDLDKAPIDAEGLVQFTGDLSMLKPLDPRRGNRRIFFDYGNRSNKRANDPRTLAHAGNGFLMRCGYTVAWLAWQGDLLPGNGRMLLDLPIARERHGPTTGPVRVEYIAGPPGITTFPLRGYASTRSHSTVSLDPREARLTRRRDPYDERRAVPPDSWCFARVEGGVGLDNQGAEQAVIPSDTHLHIPRGFEPGWIYEVVYIGRDPLALGLGHAAMRNFVSFLRYAAEDATGRVNPLQEQGGTVEKAYGWGRSQTGRCLRDFVYRGFNADAAGRKVFDGILPHMAGAGRKMAQPPLRQRERLGWPAIRGPLQPGRHLPVLLRRDNRSPHRTARHDPEAAGDGSAGHPHPDLDRVLAAARISRPYRHASQRSAAAADCAGLFMGELAAFRRPPSEAAGARGAPEFSQHRRDLDAASRDDRRYGPPGDSRVPRRADGTLVALEEWRRQFPAIPGVATPREPNSLPLLDFGPEAERGILKEPRDVVPGDRYTVLVPAIDSDGNDIAGVRAPMVQAPLGTYCGWNLRARGFGHGAMHEFSGSHIPLPETPEERRMTGDPRRSILERYPDAEAYVEAITAVAQQLVEESLMLEEDVERRRGRRRLGRPAP